MKLLHIDSSIMGDKSVSRQLSADIVKQLTNNNPTIDVQYYDLNSNPIPYLSAASFTDTAEQEQGARILQDFKDAAIIVIGAPMYNFSIPAQLKAWIDRIAIAGQTFRYTANGPEGLSGGKHVYIASSRGGIYSGDLNAMDHQEHYLETVFGFLGIDSVEFIRSEGVNLSPENAAQSIAAAKTQITELTL